MAWLRPFGLIGLVLTLLIVAMLAFRGAGPKAKGAASTTARPVPRLGEPPPEDVDRSPAAARRYVEQQNCLSECEASANLCAAREDTPTDACVSAKTACNALCR